MNDMHAQAEDQIQGSAEDRLHEGGPTGEQATVNGRPSGRARVLSTRRAVSNIVVVVISIALLLLLWYVRQVFLLAFGGLLLAVLLRIPTSWIADHTPLPDRLALVLVTIVMVGLATLGGWWMVPRMADQLGALTDLVERGLDALRAYLDGAGSDQSILGQVPSLQELLPQTSALLAEVGGVFSTAVGAVTGVAVAIVIGFYLALEPQTYVNGIVRLFPSEGRKRAREVLKSVGRALRWWLVGRVFAMVVLGILVGVGLALLDIPLALILGILAGLLSFVPVIGSFLAVVPAVLVALTQSPISALYVVLLYLAAQGLETYLLTPMVQRYAVSMPPALGLIAQLLLGLIAGALGIAFAYPLAVIGLELVKELYMNGDQQGEARGAQSASSAASAP